ncbi:C-type lectin lectoxin-Phi1-like [Branchiostoma floridae x Branchiostoma belcheri]
MKWAVLIPVFLLSVLIGGTDIDGPDEPCFSGWHMHGDHCYKLMETKADWNTAQDRCNQYGATLLCISSNDEITFIQGLISDVGEAKAVWMGLKEKDDGWYWVDGSELSLTFWAEGEPDGNGVPGFMGFHEDVTCARISRMDTRFGQWEDDQCASEYPLICKGYTYIR